jgi:hypothetical protein
VNPRGLALACAVAGTTTAVGAAGVTANEKLALVTVVADSAKPAHGLTPADFAVTEGKDPVQVVEIEPAKDPLSIVLLADTALPSDGRAATPEMRKALHAFVATVLAGEPDARIALYQVATAPQPMTEFAGNRADLDAHIDLIASGTPSGSAMLEGVITAAKKVSGRPAPRRAIVAVAMGTDDQNPSLQPKEVADAVRQSGATLWVLSVQGLAENQLTNRDAAWTRATEDTGGLRKNIVQTTQLETHLQSVANSLMSQYYLKMVRKSDGAVKGLKGQTSQHAQVLFTHWMR